MSIPASLAAPRTARDAIEDWMPGAVDRKLRHDARLLITEVVANSVLHSDAPDGAPIDLSAGWTEELIWFQVADAGRLASVTRRAPEPRGGMGLNMVQSVASDWGVSYGGGTTVWFELALPGSEPRRRLL